MFMSGADGWCRAVPKQIMAVANFRVVRLAVTILHHISKRLGGMTWPTAAEHLLMLSQASI